MRTTVTLDPDVERLIKEEIHRTHKSFKAVLNDAIREKLRSRTLPVLSSPVSMGDFLIEPRGFGELLDRMEVEAHQEVTRKLRTQT